MEGNLRPEAPYPPPPSNLGRYSELDRSEIENGKDIRRRSPDDCTKWTEEKHNSYLRHLEASFVKQLHQSKVAAAMAKCSEWSQRETQKGPTNVRNSSEKMTVLRNGCWQKNNYIRDAPRELWSTMKHGKRTLSPGFATHSHECSSSDPYLGDLFDIEREGTGQNFLDEVDECTTRFVSQAKRSKTELMDESSQQISLAYKRLLEHT